MSDAHKKRYGFDINAESSYYNRYSKFKVSDKFIRKGGEYQVEIISEFLHIARFSKRQSVVIIVKDLQSDKIAKIFMVLKSKTGRNDNPLRQFENYLFDSLLIVTNSSKDTEQKEVFDWDYKQSELCLFHKKNVFVDLIGKKCKMILGYRIKVVGYFAYVGYAIGGIFDIETNQSADEILENEIPTLYFLPREVKENEYGSFGEKEQICRIRHG